MKPPAMVKVPEDVTGSYVAERRGGTIDLEVRPDKTYTMTARGGEVDGERLSGTYSKEGNMVTMVLTEKDGKPVPSGSEPPLRLRVTPEGHLSMPQLVFKPKPRP
jgi:hypothetical protein